VNLKVTLITLGYLFLLLAGQFLWKRGLILLPGVFSSGALQILWSLVSSFYIVGGIAIYALATLLWLYLLSKYDLSYIYPLTSLSFVLGILMSFLFLEETVTWNRWTGAGVIMLGVFLVSLK